MNWKYLARRIGIALSTIFFVLMLTYLLFELSPLKPIDYLLNQLGLVPTQSGGLAAMRGSLLGSTLSQQQYEQIIAYLETFLPHGNPVINVLKYIYNILRGNWGVSLIYIEPVTVLIGSALPWTLFVVATANILNFFVGVYLGQLMAYNRGKKADQVLTQFITVKRAIPIYIYAAVFLMVFGFYLHVVPTAGAYGVNVKPGLNLPFLLSVLRHAAMPIFTLFFATFGGWALAMRGNVISQLGEDYVTYAEARGLPSRYIRSRYVGRNALLPLYTSLIISIGFSFAGSVFVEQTFSYPGVGSLYVNALTNSDWMVAMGVLFIIVTAIAVGMIVADLTYSLIDPRVRVG